MENDKKGCRYCGDRITKYSFDIFFPGGKTIIGVCSKEECRVKAKGIITENIKGIKQEYFNEIN